jgi:hypothetical protein
MKRLPLGIQTFEKIIDGDYLYVDKTEVIHRLLTTAGEVVFLSRPRRFGKSLLCSTLHSIFEGRRELFSGLAIDGLEWEWIEYPVIHIDFNAGDYTEGKIVLTESISAILDEIADRYEVSIKDSLPSVKFRNLIVALNAKFNQKVVVIIDEYDKPLLGTMDLPDIHKELRGMLKGFFGVLKSADAYLKFSFITGVTKFSKVSIFSDLNQLDDISLKPDYADICGIRQDELERDFKDGIEKYAEVNGLSENVYKERLRVIYDGYRFTDKELTVYNPFGLIKHFMDDGKFAPYWFESGSPTFLYRLMQEQNFDILDLEDCEMNVNEFTNFDIEGMQLIPLLYQSGYLTIKDYIDEKGKIKLGFPNEEVSSAFSQQLLKFMIPNATRSFSFKFPGYLIDGEPEEAMELLHQFLAGIPYDVHPDTERYYHGLIDVLFRMFGLNTRSEVRIAAGRIDTLVETRKYIYCFEFKMNNSQKKGEIAGQARNDAADMAAAASHYTAQDALDQIDSKEYLTPWSGSGKTLYKIGVVFDYEKRNITEWKIV